MSLIQPFVIWDCTYGLNSAKLKIRQSLRLVSQVRSENKYKERISSTAAKQLFWRYPVHKHLKQHPHKSILSWNYGHNICQCLIGVFLGWFFWVFVLLLGFWVGFLLLLGFLFVLVYFGCCFCLLVCCFLLGFLGGGFFLFVFCFVISINLDLPGHL